MGITNPTGMKGRTESRNSKGSRKGSIRPPQVPSASLPDIPVGDLSLTGKSGLFTGLVLTGLIIVMAMLSLVSGEKARQQAALKIVDLQIHSIVSSANEELSKITGLAASLIRDNSSSRTKGSRVISPGIFHTQIAPFMDASPFVVAAVFMPKVMNADEAIFEAASHAKGLAQYQPSFVPFGATEPETSFFPVRYVLWSSQMNDGSPVYQASLFPKSVVAGEEALTTIAKIVENSGIHASGLFIHSPQPNEFGSLSSSESNADKILFQLNNQVFWLMGAVRTIVPDSSSASVGAPLSVQSVSGIIGFEISLANLVDTAQLPSGVVVDVVRLTSSADDTNTVIKRFTADQGWTHEILGSLGSLGLGPVLLERKLGFPDQDLSIVISSYPQLDLFSGLYLPVIFLVGLVAVGAFALYSKRMTGIERKMNSGRADIEKLVEEQKRILVANDAQFSHLIESTNVVAWAADLGTKKFTYVGPQIEEMAGYPLSTWYSQGFWVHHIHPDDRDKILCTLDELKRGSYAVREYRLRKSDGSTVWVRNSITATGTAEPGLTSRLNTAPRYIQGFLVDITDQKNVQAALRKAKETAEQASRTKSEFLANMSHELRTPLNSIIGFADIMEGQSLGPLGNDRYIEYVANIQSSGRHLLDLINDILDLSKIESGRFELQEMDIDLPALLKSCYSLLQERAKNAGIHLSLSAESNLPDLFGDNRRIKQILLNILSNAIKYTNPGGSVSLAAKIVRGKGLSLSVTDNGIGILPENLEVALQKFSQIDSSLARTHEGSGLGLSIAKSLTELHGGKLVLDSKYGHGTRVTIWMPENRLLWDENASGRGLKDNRVEPKPPENRQVA